MNELPATYYDGNSSAAHRVSVSCDDGVHLLVTGLGWERRDTLDSVQITPPLAGTYRSLHYADGASIQVDDNALLQRWFVQRNRLENRVDALEGQWRNALIAILIVALGGWFAFAIAVPWAANRVAHAIPLSVERTIGDQVSGMLDQFGFSASALDSARRERIVARFAAYAATVPGADAYSLRFQQSRIGANAFALPGGLIVVTDELVDELDDEQILAVLAHEAGHQQQRHVMRSVLQDSAVILIAAFFTGDVSSASAVVIAIPTFLMRNHYSRGFENEADEFAFASLQAFSVSPRRFAEALQKLEESHAAKSIKSQSDAKLDNSGDSDSADYLSTHPASAARIAHALEAAEHFEAEPSSPTVEQ